MVRNSQYTGIDDRRALPPESGWHLKKEVNLSIIISLVTIGVSCVMAYADLKKDIELIRADSVVLHQRDAKLETNHKEAMRDLQVHMEKMDSKLDRLIERGQK
jgi:hypothetical protein